MRQGKSGVIVVQPVSAAILIRGDKVFIGQRKAGKRLEHLWEFPGGKLNPGEDLVACLKREICEELGVDIDVSGPFGTYRHAYTHFRVTLHAFCCQLAGASRGAS